MVRFLHTADWQLGMTRHFLGEEAQARFTDDRFAAIRAMLALAAKERCAFVVVCGDVFETNQVDRKTVARALDALETTELPVYLLPGNHDPLDAGSVYRSRAFRERRPDNVAVLESCTPVEVAPGVEIVGVPWTTKRPLRDLVADACGPLAAEPGTVRIAVAHGALDTLSPNRDDPAVIGVAAAEQALREGRIHYLALGDRHSRTIAVSSRRIAYSGTPVATDYDEVDPGHVLVVDVDGDHCDVTPHLVGAWTFLRREFELNTDDDVTLVEQALAEPVHKERTIVKLALRGTLTLRRHARLLEILDRARDLLAAVEVHERLTDLVVVPDEGDFADLPLAGFAKVAADRLRAEAAAGDASARDALGLLVRLARRDA